MKKMTRLAVLTAQSCSMHPTLIATRASTGDRTTATIGYAMNDDTSSGAAIG